MYEFFSNVYDEMVLNENIASYKKINEFLKNNNFKGKKILELACGTGNMALLFAKDGYDITATDLSKNMLEKAIAKRNTKNIDCKFEIMDMLQFNIKEKYDMIYCLLDGISYLPQIENIEKVISNVYQCLNMNGYFIFDYITYTNYKKIYGKLECENKYIDINNKTIYWIENYNKNKINTKMLLYEKYDNNRFDIFEESHEQYMYEDNEIESILINDFEILKEQITDIRRTLYCRKR